MVSTPQINGERIRFRLREYLRLTRLDRPVGSLLLLWPTLWALWIAADGWPDPLVLAVFVAGVFLMRSAGCAINDFADREIDGHVWRTDQRPLAVGSITPAEALGVFAVLALAAFGLVLLMNRLTILLSLVGVVLAATYPFMKRFHHLPQVHLGAAFSWAIPMAFAAQSGEVPPVAWLIYVTNLLWTTAYDTMYGMADREDDLKIGVKSTAILFGRQDRWMVGLLQLLTLVGLVLIGRQAGLGAVYYAGLVVATGFGIYQQYLIRDREPRACFQAFRNNNWLGGSVFAGLAIDVVFMGI